jgi:hypothetical protein
MESWAPEYGSAYDTDETLADPERVDESVEVEGAWDPIDGVDDGVEKVAFVDGVRRIDARLVIDEPVGPVPGLCGTYGVGAVIWDRSAVRSTFDAITIDRLAVFGSGRGMQIPVAGQIAYRCESVAGTDPGLLIQHFHGAMRRAEGRLSEQLAQRGLFVIGDGPINDLSATDKVGYIKTHRVPYLAPERAPIIGRLEPGQRTPMFLLGAKGAYERYSWYVKLAAVLGGHSWSGVVRCEVAGSLGDQRAAAIANRTAALLPMVASVEHIDPRAPQNLVPIGALERELRRSLGDPNFVNRELRSAVMRQATVGVTE